MLSFQTFHSKHWSPRGISDLFLDNTLARHRQTVLKSRSISTVCKYSNGWSRTKNWASSKPGVVVIPAKPLVVAFYLQSLIDEAIVKKLTFSAIDTAIYSIRWVHRMAGYSSPTDDPIVSATAEAARRMLGKPVSPKEPLQLDVLESMAQFYNTPNAPLKHIRFLFVVLVGYSGFLRIEEIINVRVKDISFVDKQYMSIFIEKRKNDQHREGHTSLYDCIYWHFVLSS